MGIFALCMLPQTVSANSPGFGFHILRKTHYVLDFDYVKWIFIISVYLELFFMILLTQASRLKIFVRTVFMVFLVNIVTYSLFTLYQIFCVLPIIRSEHFQFLEKEYFSEAAVLYLLMIFIAEAIIVLFEAALFHQVLKKYFSFKSILFYTILINGISFYTLAIIRLPFFDYYHFFNLKAKLLPVSLSILSVFGTYIAKLFITIKKPLYLHFSSAIIYAVSFLIFLPVALSINFFSNEVSYLNDILSPILPLLIGGILFVRLNINRYELNQKELRTLMICVNGSVMLGTLIIFLFQLN